MTVKRLIIAFCFIVFLSSCEKSKEQILLWDQVGKTQYYKGEIFNENNQKIYGKWEFLYSSGGIGGGKIDPEYDYLEVVQYGIYGIINRNSIDQFGKLLVSDQDDKHALITFFPDPKYMTDFQMVRRQTSFTGNDTLILWDMMYDGYFAYYKRIR
jgi:hypothetical protein